MKLYVILNFKGSNVATIRPDVPVRDLVTELAARNIGALVVSADGTTVDGMVSERDVVRALGAHGPGALDGPVSAIMTNVIQCAPPDASVEDIMALMTNRRVRHIPVVDESGAMVGIVSIGDVVKNRLGELEGERDALIQYVTSG